MKILEIGCKMSVLVVPFPRESILKSYPFHDNLLDFYSRFLELFSRRIKLGTISSN